MSVRVNVWAAFVVLGACASASLARAESANASVAHTPEAENVVRNLLSVGCAEERRYVVSWTHPWPEYSGNCATRNPDGSWSAKPIDDISLKGYVQTQTGHDPLLYFTDFYCGLGTWLGQDEYARNLANMEGFIKKAYDSWHSIPVFSWHLGNPYAPHREQLPPQAKTQDYRYRYSCDGYPQEHRYVIREILEGTGESCGQGRANVKHADDLPPFANPRAWYDWHLDRISTFLKRLVDRQGKPIPVVVRLFHECEDDWQWWGAGSVTRDDYVRIFRYTVEELRRRTGLGSLLFMYSPDRYWATCGDRNSKGDFLYRYPGDDVVDIIGFDDYSIGGIPKGWTGDKASGIEASLKETIRKARLVSAFSQEHGKPAGIVETSATSVDSITGLKMEVSHGYGLLRRIMTAEGVSLAFFNTWGASYTVPSSDEGKKAWRDLLALPETILAGKGVDLTRPGTQEKTVGVWKKYAGNPVMGSPELGTCFDLNVVPWGSARYNNYFSWRSQKSIALSRSEDGIHWTHPEKCLEPDLSTGWEDRISRASVWFKDGVYHMWYTGQARGYSRIGYATSKDGVRFTRTGRLPVVIPERPHEGFSVMNPYVRWDDERQVWRMWYASGETYEPNVLCYAESKDGLKWEKSPINPVFVKGAGWDKDRVGGCEVHPLQDGRWVMFYIGYSDIHTARIGAAISQDGITGWTRLKANPLVSPTPGEWDSAACYKPSVVMEKDRWLLWYNGRTDNREYIGMVEHRGLDLGPLDVPYNRVLSEELVRRRFDRFNLDDDELYVNAINNRQAQAVIGSQIPLFECPDEDVERIYYFRWWTYRKHLRKTKDGTGWVVTEFLPEVSWAGEENTISCPFGHHLREGRWIRNSECLDGYVDFMLTKGNVNGSRAYACWPAWASLERAKVTGDRDFLVRNLDRFVANYDAWMKGWQLNGYSLKEVENRQGAKGVPLKSGFREERGLFDITGSREGSEFALSSDGARPLVNAAMWAEASAIAEIARLSGQAELADRFARCASDLQRNVKTRLWNVDKKFFTALSVDGKLDDVCELHGYAPFYFGMDLKDYGAAWTRLTEETGFAAPKGLTFPARNTPGFDLSVDLARHECLWNGPSWPYATSIALTALYASLQKGDASPVGASDFAALVRQYAAQQTRRLEDGRIVPWIDENLDPMTGEWIARRQMIAWDRQGIRKLAYRERGKDYNHSTFCDLVIAGLCGFIPHLDGTFDVKPLAPSEWDWWCVDGIRFHGKDVTILFDRDGTRYGKGKGLVVLVDGEVEGAVK